MTTNSTSWEQRVAKLWAEIDSHTPEDFVASMEKLAAELLPSDSPVAAFERASSLDSTGHPDRAVPLYRQALAGGLEANAAAAPRSSWPARCATSARLRRASYC